MKDQGCDHVEASQLICRANQLNGLYLVTALAFNEIR